MGDLWEDELGEGRDREMFEESKKDKSTEKSHFFAILHNSASRRGEAELETSAQVVEER